MNLFVDTILNYVKNKMPDCIINCKCETCGAVFLEDMFLKDFLQKSNCMNPSRLRKPDDWYKKAHEHFKADCSHEIKFKCPPLKVPELALLGMKDFNFIPRDLSEFWRKNEEPNQI
jgi:hypothetical protein